jgi:hypothetical protein
MIMAALRLEGLSVFLYGGSRDAAFVQDKEVVDGLGQYFGGEAGEANPARDVRLTRD